MTHRWVPALMVAATLAVSSAQAGPPFVTDDPEPTDLGHWEIYNFATAMESGAGWTGEAGDDLNYGAAKNLQLTATLPLAFASGVGVGTGEIELAAKYRLLSRDSGSPLDVAVFPRVFLPTGSAKFGPERPSLLLPLWAGRDFGPWSVFGGGGWEINPGPGNRNYWLAGLAVSRAFGARLTLGAELYGQGAAMVHDRAFAGANLAAIYKISKHWSLMGSAGPGVADARREDRVDGYFALEADF